MRKALKELKFTNFVGLTLAGIINAVGVAILLSPVGLLDGGLSGTALLLDKVTPSYLILSMFLIILNFPFYIIGSKKIGLQFTIYSLYAITIYSLFAFIFKDVIEFDFLVKGSPVVGNDLVLGAIFGGLLSGIGSGLTIRFGGALDGIEVMAVLFAKKIGLSVGVFVMLYNIILYSISAICFSSFIIPLYSVLAYFVAIKTVDFIVDGVDKGKQAYIITNYPKAVCEQLSKDFRRGLTVINAKGYYSNQDKTIIYCVINRFELVKLKKSVKLADNDAFVSISDVSDTMGNQVKFRGKVKKEKE